MVKKSLLKDALRQITLNKKRFISLLLIIIVGAGFYVGLKSTAQDMEITAKNFYKETNLFDLKVESSTGIYEKNKEEIKNIDGINQVSLTKTLDVTTTIDNKDYVIKLNSINEDKENSINKLILTKGRFPKTINEGLVEEKFLTDNNLSIGDLVTLTPSNENDLRAKKIKIVGVVKSSYYSSKDRGESNLEDGKADYFMYLEETDFNFDYYQEVFITIKDADKYDTYSKEYDSYVNKYIEKINEIVLKNSNLIYEEKTNEINNEISILEEKLNDLNQTDLPIESLNESIKEVSESLENKKEELSKLSEVSVYSTKRSETPSFYEYKSEIERIKSISNVFSLVFFLVTILISLTIIIKMIDEEKKQIGTLRTIGYSKFELVFKYAFYAFLISFLGSIIGSLLFYKIIPLVIGCCYNKFYDMPNLSTTLQMNYIIFAILFSCFTTILASIFTFFINNKKAPAKLVENKPSKTKKIFLEKFPKIWAKLSFSNKLTIKNVFKYKRRFFITIIGICCSTALILASLGIKNSMMNIVNKQFQKINKYDMVITTNGNISNEDKANIENELNNQKEIKEMLLTYKSKVKVENENAYLIVPNDKDEINDFITLRKDNKDLKLKNDGIILSENLANILKVKVGQEIKITLSNNKIITTKISAITKNYIENYAYMSPTLYNKLVKEKPNYTTILVKNNKLNKKEKQNLRNNISSISNIENVELSETIKENYKDIMNTLNYVIIIFIISAIFLTFLVLYNIGYINLEERKKELKTLKSLGFYSSEITKYIFKEILVLCIIGILIGLIIGSFLTYYIIKSCEINTFIFSFNINIFSYLITIVITLFFVLLINLFMYFKIKELDIR